LTAHIETGERRMKRSMDQKTATSTAATQLTEPEVVAAISSGDGHNANEQAVRERAYSIWEEEGRPEGRHLDHWLRAEAEIKL
jgi:Protein of unknown function (DUF2934)